MVLLQSNEVNKNFELVAFDLPNANGQGSFSSATLDKDLVLIAFICNHCPYVHRIIDDFNNLAKKWSAQVNTVAISANDPNYEDADSFANMKIFAQKNNFSFPYLFDESQNIATAYGAVCTPDLFVFKKVNGKYLHRYRGRLDDLDRAYTELSSKQEITSFEQIPSAGCSIKWRS